MGVSPGFLPALEMQTSTPMQSAQKEASIGWDVMRSEFAQCSTRLRLLLTKVPGYSLAGILSSGGITG